VKRKFCRFKAGIMCYYFGYASDIKSYTYFRQTLTNI